MTDGIKIWVDAQLPPGLARWLAEQGHSAQHVDELGLSDAEDLTIWNHALSADAIIVTKDEDFAERTARTATGPIIVWLRIGNCTRQQLVQLITTHEPAIHALDTDPFETLLVLS